ncbi:MAG: hypothetical protein KatS3mg062_1365 [Tepidiforma sp.]|nr:MAG: hypothetical protein KatS3mg062_1365 [Tepidiforma sp.]
MKTRVISRTIVPAFVALASVAAAAADEGGGTAGHAAQAGGTAADVLPAVLWSLVGVGVFAVVLGVLYLFKRQVGGFPENPDWVAPISIMRSRDLPADDDAHGHGDSHDAHAPAH